MSRDGICNLTTGELEVVGTAGSLAGHDLGGRTIVSVPAGWPFSQRWDDVTQAFVADLTAPKAAAKRAVEAARDATMNGGCPATIGTIDSDEQSRLYVAGAVSMAQIASAAAQPFLMRWRLQDNSYADLDASEMIALGVELGGFVNDCCQTAFDLKDEIDAAADESEVDAVDIAAAFAALIA